MSIRFISIAASAAAAVAISAASAAQTTPARPAAQAPRAAPASAQAPQTRAAVLRGLDTAFKSIDRNGNGTLDATELSAAESRTQQQRIAARRGQVDAQFGRLDTNKDGLLSKAEFMALAPSAPPSTNNGAAMLGQLDKNKDGRVSADEYRAPVLTRFDGADANKDGTLTAAERQAANRTAQATRRN